MFWCNSCSNALPYFICCTIIKQHHSEVLQDMAELWYNIAKQDRRVNHLPPTKIYTDETMMELIHHGSTEFPFQYYLDDIAQFVDCLLYTSIQEFFLATAQHPCVYGKSAMNIHTSFCHRPAIYKIHMGGGKNKGRIRVCLDIKAGRKRAAQLAAAHAASFLSLIHI